MKIHLKGAARKFLPDLKKVWPDLNPGTVINGRVAGKAGSGQILLQLGGKTYNAQHPSNLDFVVGQHVFFEVTEVGESQLVLKMQPSPVTISQELGRPVLLEALDSFLTADLHYLKWLALPYLNQGRAGLERFAKHLARLGTNYRRPGESAEGEDVLPEGLDAAASDELVGILDFFTRGTFGQGAGDSDPEWFFHRSAIHSYLLFDFASVRGLLVTPTVSGSGGTDTEQARSQVEQGSLLLFTLQPGLEYRLRKHADQLKMSLAEILFRLTEMRVSGAPVSHIDFNA